MFEPSLTANIIVGSWLLIAAAGKWINLRWFVEVVDSFHMIPATAVSLVSLGIVGAETVCGAFVLAGIARPLINLVAISLLTLFTATIALQVMKGRTHLECGCGSGGRVGWLLVMRNVGLLSLAGLGLVDRSTAGGFLLLWVGLGLAFLPNLTRLGGLVLIQLATVRSR